MMSTHENPRTGFETTLAPSEVNCLVCPACRDALTWRGRESVGRLAEGTLVCEGCAMAWAVRDGVPRLYREELVRGNDRLLRAIYNALPSLHDPLTTVLTPLLQGITERSGREHIMKRLDIAGAQPPSGRPLRILEVGIGGGANLALVRRDLGWRSAEIWGVDLSEGMLSECRKLTRKQGHRDVRLLMCDAHALPFPDGMFDRVFHVGGIGGYSDPRTALAEMARVAVPGSPIVVVDEQLDRSRPQGLFHRAAFRAITFYDPDPRSPSALLPDGATGVIDEQAARYYYCLTFRMPVFTAPGALRVRSATAGGLCSAGHNLPATTPS